jgi:hypothetical protein
MGLAVRATAVPEPFVVPPSQKFDGNDGSWSTFKVSVGTPGQDFRVLPSTKSGVTYVVIPDGCDTSKGDPTNCAQLRGSEIFNSAQNIGFQVNVSTSWSAIGQYDVDFEQSLNYTAAGFYGFDKVSLGAAADSKSMSVDHQVVGGIAELDYFLGMLPLGQAGSSFSTLGQPTDSLLYQLRNKTMIPSFSYAYTAGAKYRLKSVLGSLILGGYDSTRYKPNNNEFSYTFSTDPSKLLTVGVESIMATNSLKGTFSLSSGSHFSVIDSTVPHLWLPTAICTHFEQAFGLTYDPRTDLYLVNDTTHKQLISKNPTITVKLVNSLANSATNYTNIQLPYAAFDLQASYPYYPNATNYFPIRRAANDTQYALGRTLLQEAYLIVDYERANFSISQAAFPDPLPAANIIPITSKAGLANSPSSSTKASGLATGAIVGIAIGVAILIFAAVFALFFYRRRKTRQEHYELGNNQVPNDAYTWTAPMKVDGSVSELTGAGVNELPSSPYPSDKKSPVVVNDVPQELHAQSRDDVAAWKTGHLRPHEASGTPVSELPSGDGTQVHELEHRPGGSAWDRRFEKE